MRKTAKGRHAEYVDNKLASISIYEKKRLLDDRNAEGLPLILYNEGDCFKAAHMINRRVEWNLLNIIAVAFVAYIEPPLR